MNGGPPTECTTPQRVAIVRALPGLGDGLCAVPALRALRRAWPNAELTVVGLPGGEWLRDRFPRYVDRWLPCDAWPGLPEVDGPRVVAERFLRRARARRFDLALQMHGSGEVSNGLTSALGARRWIGLGFEAPGAVLAVGGRLEPYPDDRHEIERCLAVARAAGAAADDPSPEFPLHAEDVAAVGRWLAPDERVAVVHPGASVPERRWHPDGFARVVGHLLADGEPPVTRVVFTGGAGERDVVTEILDRLRPSERTRVLDLTGATPLGPLAALLTRSDVLVANDTGVVHLAAAVETPTLVIGGASDWTRWRPWGSVHRTLGGRTAGGWPTPDEVVEAIDAVAVANQRAGAGVTP